MSSATTAVTYTSVYTDSEPGRAFWEANDEEISEGGIPRVIVLGYDGLPIQPVAPPSPDYILGPKDPQTPLVPQDEDEREPMFVQAHDPDYVPKPIYPEYIPLEDEHEFPAEEQPLPPVDSPTAESPGYVTESDPEKDPEEYEDDETEDGPVDYPMDGGDNGDDDGDSFRDDADGEDDDEEEEEHLALADSAIVVPVDEPVFPPEGTEPAIPPPSTDITIGARITIRPQTSISLPPEAEECLAQCLAAPALPSLPLPRLPHPYGSPNHVRAPLGFIAAMGILRASCNTTYFHHSVPASINHTQSLHYHLYASTHHYHTLPDSLFIINHQSTSREEYFSERPNLPPVERDAKARRQRAETVGYGIRDTWVDLRETAEEVAPVTLEGVNTRVTELAAVQE
ncbi:hypothetical protein Tco_1401370 [Tanacetum coccineum]